MLPAFLLVAFLAAVAASVSFLIRYEKFRAERERQDRRRRVMVIASAIAGELKRKGTLAFDLFAFADSQGMPGDEAAEGAVEVYRSICARAMEDGVISPAEERLLTQLGQALDLDSVDRSRLLDEATKKWTLQTAQVASEERQRIEASQAELVRRSLNVGSDETPLVTAGADTVEKLGRMHSKVAGVTMTNDDGSSRQHLIRRYCRAGQRLVVVREPDNPYDTHAVAIYLARPKASIGFIGSHISPFLGATIDRGGRVDVTISEVTGGKGGKYYGANIVIDFTKLPDVKRSWAKKKT